MPSVYCARCGRASPEGARFCSHCGAPLVRAGAERPGESTSTISLGGADLADGDYEEPLAESATTEALPSGTALLLVKRGPNAGSRFLLDTEVTSAGRAPDSRQPIPTQVNKVQRTVAMVFPLDSTGAYP